MDLLLPHHREQILMQTPKRLVAIAVLAGLLVFAPLALARAPQGPFPAQDTPPPLDRQTCLPQPGAAPKAETSPRGMQSSTERLPSAEGAGCPRPDPDRNIVVPPEAAPSGPLPRTGRDPHPQ